MPRAAGAKVWNDDLVKALTVRKEAGRRKGQAVFQWQKAIDAIKKERGDIYAAQTGNRTIYKLPKAEKLGVKAHQICVKVIHGEEEVVPPGLEEFDVETPIDRPDDGLPDICRDYLNSMQFRGGGYAILCAFHVSGRETLTKQDIATIAPGFCNDVFIGNFHENTHNSCGWRSINVLENRSLVMRAGNYQSRMGGDADTFTLTPSGALFIRFMIEKFGEPTNHGGQVVAPPVIPAARLQALQGRRGGVARRGVDYYRERAAIRAEFGVNNRAQKHIGDEEELRAWLRTANVGDTKDFNLSLERRKNLHQACDHRLPREGYLFEHESFGQGRDRTLRIKLVSRPGHPPGGMEEVQPPAPAPPPAPVPAVVSRGQQDHHAHHHDMNRPANVQAPKVPTPKRRPAKDAAALERSASGGHVLGGAQNSDLTPREAALRAAEARMRRQMTGNNTDSTATVTAAPSSSAGAALNTPTRQARSAPAARPSQSSDAGKSALTPTRPAQARGNKAFPTPFEAKAMVAAAATPTKTAASAPEAQPAPQAMTKAPALSGESTVGPAQPPGDNDDLARAIAMSMQQPQSETAAAGGGAGAQVAPGDGNDDLALAIEMSMQQSQPGPAGAEDGNAEDEQLQAALRMSMEDAIWVDEDDAQLQQALQTSLMTPQPSRQTSVAAVATAPGRTPSQEPSVQADVRPAAARAVGPAAAALEGARAGAGAALAPELTLMVDNRERRKNNNPREIMNSLRRILQGAIPVEQMALPVGDYAWVDSQLRLIDLVVVERKRLMDIVGRSSRAAGRAHWEQIRRMQGVGVRSPLLVVEGNPSDAPGLKVYGAREGEEEFDLYRLVGEILVRPTMTTRLVMVANVEVTCRLVGQLSSVVAAASITGAGRIDPTNLGSTTNNYKNKKTQLQARLGGISSLKPRMIDALLEEFCSVEQLSEEFRLCNNRQAAAGMLWPILCRSEDKDTALRASIEVWADICGQENIGMDVVELLRGITEPRVLFVSLCDESDGRRAMKPTVEVWAGGRYCRIHRCGPMGGDLAWSVDTFRSGMVDANGRCVAASDRYRVVVIPADRILDIIRYMLDEDKSKAQIASQVSSQIRACLPDPSQPADADGLSRGPEEVRECRTFDLVVIEGMQGALARLMRGSADVSHRGSLTTVWEYTHAVLLADRVDGLTVVNTMNDKATATLVHRVAEVVVTDCRMYHCVPATHAPPGPMAPAADTFIVLSDSEDDSSESLMRVVGSPLKRQRTTASYADSTPGSRITSMETPNTLKSHRATDATPGSSRTSSVLARATAVLATVSKRQDSQDTPDSPEKRAAPKRRLDLGGPSTSRQPPPDCEVVELD